MSTDDDSDIEFADGTYISVYQEDAEQIMVALGFNPSEVWVSDESCLWDFEGCDTWEEGKEHVARLMGEELDLSEPIYLMAKRLYDRRNK